MKGIAICVSLFVFLMYTSDIRAQTPRPGADEADKRAILKLEKDVDHATKMGSRAVLDAAYAADFAGINAAGGRSTRKQMVEFYSGEPVMDIHESDETEIRTLASTAIVTARLKYKYNQKYEDQTVKWMRYTRVYQKRVGKWQIVAEHYTFINPD